MKLTKMPFSLMTQFVMTRNSIEDHSSNAIMLSAILLIDICPNSGKTEVQLLSW
jgi:hypothetical protein